MFYQSPDLPLNARLATLKVYLLRNFFLWESLFAPSIFLRNSGNTYISYPLPSPLLVYPLRGELPHPTPIIYPPTIVILKIPNCGISKFYPVSYSIGDELISSQTRLFTDH